MKYLVLAVLAIVNMLSFSSKKNVKDDYVNSDLLAEVRSNECIGECFIINDEGKNITAKKSNSTLS